MKRWFPRRIAHPHLRLRKVALDEIRADLQRARSAERLHARDAAIGARRAVVAEHERLHGAAIMRKTGHRQIRLWTEVFQDRQFRLAHGLHHRQTAFVVKVNADAQVDLIGARIFLEVFVQRQDRVAGVSIDMFEYSRLSGREGSEG